MPDPTAEPIVTAAAEHAPIVQTAPLLVNAQTAGELLGLPPRTFERLLAAGRLPSPIRLGKRRFWRHRDLEDFVEGGCRREATE